MGFVILRFVAIEDREYVLCMILNLDGWKAETIENNNIDLV